MIKLSELRYYSQYLCYCDGNIFFFIIIIIFVQYPMAINHSRGCCLPQLRMGTAGYHAFVRICFQIANNDSSSEHFLPSGIQAHPSFIGVIVKNAPGFWLLKKQPSCRLLSHSENKYHILYYVFHYDFMKTIRMQALAL